MTNFHIKFILQVVTVVLAFFLAFTPFYSLAYILAVVLSLQLLSNFFIFQTLFQRFIALLLVFIAIIPLAGLVCWLFDAPLIPIYNLLGFSLVCLLLYSKSPKSPPQTTALFNKTDLIAALVALAPALIILFSFMSPNLRASLFQLTSEGWDNGPHIQMIQSSALVKGYTYSTAEEYQKKNIQGSNSYPQGWHLATADFVNGFGGDRFNPKQPIHTIAAYMIAVIGWMMLAAYICVIISCRLLALLSSRKALGWRQLLPVAIILLGMHAIVLYTALVHGFSNYIGTIAYVLMISATAIEVLQKQTNSTQSYLIMILSGTTAVLTWFLVFPAVALTILLAILYKKPSLKDSLLMALKNWRLLLFFIGGLSAMLLQILIFQKYSPVGGSDQLNVGSRINPFTSTVGVFVVNQILLGIVVTVNLLFIVSSKTTERARKITITLTAPWLIMAACMYLYQNITIGYNSYYMSKVFGICLIVNSLLFAAITAAWVNKVVRSQSTWAISLVSLSIIGLLIIGTGQSVTGISKLFPANSRTSYPVAARIVEALPDAIDGKSYIVVMTGKVNNDGSFEDRHGNLEQSILYQKTTCAFYVGLIKEISPVTTREGFEAEENINAKVKKLGKCADSLVKQQKSLIVIASKNTEKKIKDLKKSNISVRLTEQPQSK